MMYLLIYLMIFVMSYAAFLEKYGPLKNMVDYIGSAVIFLIWPLSYSIFIIICGVLFILSLIEDIQRDKYIGH